MPLLWHGRREWFWVGTPCRVGFLLPKGPEPLLSSDGFFRVNIALSKLRPQEKRAILLTLLLTIAYFRQPKRPPDLRISKCPNDVRSRYERRAIRSGALSRWSMSCARRRRQRQDTRDHPEECPCDRGERLRAEAHRRADLHEQSRARNARAHGEAARRENAHHARQGRPPGAGEPVDHLHVSLARRADHAAGGSARRPETAVLDHGFQRLLRSGPGTA